jgi:hypothetical protein
MAVCAPEGFRLALAAEVAELDEASSLDALQEIHSRSLVEELDRTTRRYRLHALVRKAAGASNLQRRKHAECVRRKFQDWETGWRQCERDMADWQAAFSWLLGQSEGGDGSWFSSVRTKIRQTFSSGRGAWSMASNLAYVGYALTWRLGRLTEAHEICERMAKEANRRDHTGSLQAWYGNQALILHVWGRLDEAMALHKKEEAICLKLGNQDGLQASYANQAVILQAWGRVGEAMALLKKQEAICLELGNQDGLQRSYGNQASILKAWGRLDEAMALHKTQEAICLELGNQASLAYCYWNWGLLAREQSDSKTEREKLERALALFTERKMPREIKAVQNLLDETNSNSPRN